MQLLTGLQVGQRVSNGFHKHHRVFLAGDAIHTHSPKVGQGMNVSIQDTFNLGWKLGLVVKGLAKPCILRTYEPERRPVAEGLIDFDTRWSGLFSGRPIKDALNEAGVSMEEFGELFRTGLIWASNIGVEYPPSELVASADEESTLNIKVRSRPDLASKIRIGQRLPSVQVLNHADARPWQFQQLLKSDGCFRLIVFAGDMTKPQQKERIHSFCASLNHDYSFLQRYCMHGLPRCGVPVEILTLHSSKRKDVELCEFPQLLYPFDDENGWQYDKVFADDESYLHGHGHAYEFYGVNPEQGCVVVLRPDQHVALIAGLEDSHILSAYFEGIFVGQ
jgi:phenol 2-monooxygenase